MEPGRLRFTFPNGRVMVVDTGKNCFLTLLPGEKQATLMQGGQANDEQQDFVGQLRKLREGAEPYLGQSQIDGRIANGFRTRSQGDMEWVLWLDPASNLPIRVETSGSVLGETKVIMSEFAFDIPLDESLFSLVPPEGYAIGQRAPLDVSEEGFVEALRICAQLMDGEFPPALNVHDILQSVSAKYKAMHPAEGDRAAAVTRLAASLSWVLCLSKDNDWHYAGKGVRLGDSQTPIFWYTNAWMAHKPFKSRIIYGDLSVRVVEPGQLPKP